MALSRGQFLKSLGGTMGNLAAGAGVAAADEFLRQVKNRFPDPTEATPPLAGFFTHGSRTGNRLALTFDDGPHPESSDVLLAALAQRQLTATFFLIGERLVAHPEIARRIVAAGHEIGNHTFTHAKPTGLSAPRLAEEIQKTQDACRELLGVTPKSFRPPFGAMHRGQIAAVQALGLRSVLWDVDSGDWQQPSYPAIEGLVASRAQNGSIILCHDRPGPLVAEIGHFLEGLQLRNVTFSRLCDLA